MLGTKKINADSVFDSIRGIRDSELPYTLEQLNVVRKDLITVSNNTGNPRDTTIDVHFVPTVPHCHMAVLTGLAILSRLQSIHGASLTQKFLVQILPGSHANYAEINRQLADRERVASALENPQLRAAIELCIESLQADEAGAKVLEQMTANVEAADATEEEVDETEVPALRGKTTAVRSVAKSNAQPAGRVRSQAKDRRAAKIADLRAERQAEQHSREEERRLREEVDQQQRKEASRCNEDREREREQRRRAAEELREREREDRMREELEAREELERVSAEERLIADERRHWARPSQLNSFIPA